MIKEIKYSGITTNPSDYECTDGTLSDNIGLVQEHGTLRCLLEPSTIENGEDNKLCVYIHKTNDNKRIYIYKKIYNNSSWSENEEFDDPEVFRCLSYRIEDSTEYIDILDRSENVFDRKKLNLNIINVTSIGNTLLVLSDQGLYYLVWDNGEYINLGKNLPDLKVSFALSCLREYSEAINLTKDVLNDKEGLTNTVMAQVNKLVAEQAKKGNFIFPFFVRAAYRLYDGSLTMHTSPVLMVPSSGVAPVIWGRINSDEGFSGHISCFPCNLRIFEYNGVALNIGSVTRHWKDIISSVDIFVSSPFYTYNQNGFIDKDEIRNFSDADDVGFSISDYHNGVGYTPSLWDIKSKLESYHLDSIKKQLKLPAKVGVNEDIKNAALFYFVKSVDLTNTNGLDLIDIEEGVLSSLQTRELMSDDYDSHDRLIPEYAYIYNNRLNLSNISKEVFKGHGYKWLFPRVDNVYFPEDAGKEGDGNRRLRRIYFYLEDSGGKEFIFGGSDSDYIYSSSGCVNYYIYHPNPKVKKAVVIYYKWEDEEIFDYCETFEMTPHPFLNGSVHFSNFQAPAKSYVNPITGNSTINENLIERFANKLYTSEVNNPFYFPVQNINSIGKGEVLAIASATKALSEGQFGQFPLYAFTTDGIWALEVSQTGTFSTCQPISQDVLINKKSFVQIDNGIVFATDEGVKLLIGSDSSVITDVIFSERTTNWKPPVNLSFDLEQRDSSFNREFISNCNILYDYANQLLLIYNNTCNGPQPYRFKVTEYGGYFYKNVSYDYDFKFKQSFIYNIKTKTWSKMNNLSILENIPSYPRTYASVFTEEGGMRIVDFSELTDDPLSSTQLLITRPLKLDHPDKLKTITTVIQRGHFQSGHVKQILYGSRDLTHWNPIWSSTDHYLRGFAGTPYKYFRIVVITTLTKDEYLEGCTIECDLRQTNMLH